MSRPDQKAWYRRNRKRVIARVIALRQQKRRKVGVLQQLLTQRWAA